MKGLFEGMYTGICNSSWFFNVSFDRVVCGYKGEREGNGKGVNLRDECGRERKLKQVLCRSYSVYRRIKRVSLAYPK